ncbi:FAD-dependent oxidoreductase [Kutzneria kofuensis]|uniref:2-polyprenyl-6-methoxyphenol hydroxylase-like FAD-dependent oxidoreductase n=1 Tax=Kutzneria kofuensis TaxID=103725 RepID=A0A7W9NLM0_9PSEU|nr:FAD-dependent oxidoreductase [Kutzneria kofuensis]MBB5896438.1 2-polyprenyl-6-methoxyphenol hydroxylase-like FAD-dependent oxidoreductase [Kutzneria kofuensis]
MNHTRKTLDVLIAGAGPTGTTLAIDLVRRGLGVRVIDKAAHAFEGSRAKGIQPRTLEVLDDLGILDDVLAGSSDYPRLGIHLGPVTVPWRMFRNRERTTDVPYPNTRLMPQYRTDSVLRDRLGQLGGQVEYGRELVEFDQGDTSVTATVTGNDGPERITARYLVGAEGGSSAVRKHLGVGFLGETDDRDRMLIVDAVTTGLSRHRWHVWPGAKGRFVGACPLPHTDLFQWMVRLAPDEEPPEDEEAITRRVRAHTRNRYVELRDIRWRSVFRPNIRLAEAYRRGRVFLAGDAAHVHTPAGAQGLNTGIQDAYNLGWKLAQVLAGADARLLDSYEAERLPIAAGVLGLSTQKYEGIAKLDPSSLRRGKDEQQLSLTYHGGPLAPGDGDRTTTLRVGDRAPDTELLGTDGTTVRLFDTYRGPHFTVVAYGPDAAAVSDELDWPAAGAPLRRVVIDADADADHALTDPRHDFRRIHGIEGDTVLLIRPDGYVGHIATRDFLGSTHSAARAMTPVAQPETAG